MRKCLIIIVLISIISVLVNFEKSVRADEPLPQVIIPKGTFVKCISPTLLSTAIADIGDEVTLLNLQDMYIEEYNVIPKNSKFIGEITDIKEPVQGTNAVMKIEINKFITPDNQSIPVKATIYSNGNNYLGGELTHPAYYNKMPHYTQGWQGGVLQYTPTNIREMGMHTMVRPGVELILMLDDNVQLN